MPIETLTFKKSPICYTRRIKAFRRLLFPSTHAQIPVPFSGTIHFVDFSFKTPAGIVKVPTTDVQTSFDYAVKASPILSEYCSQYGKNSIKINNLLANTVTLRGSTYNDLDVQTWVNDLVIAHNLPANDAIIILNPLGIVNTDAPISQGVGGYHNFATIPFIFVNVFGTPLTVADQADFYAMILSHEIAEMVVDPYADLSQPEVCDSCAGNCNVDYRNYFDNNGKWLGGNAVLGYAFLTDGVVTPNEAPRCPASANACIYDPATLGPPVPINPPLTTSFILTSGTLSVGERIGFLASADGGVQPYAFNWNFGDSGTANGNIVVHSFSKAGTFKVTLTTTDNGLLIFKQTATSTQDLVVVGTTPPPPQPTPLTVTIGSPTPAQVGDLVQFTATANGGALPYSFMWDFGDGFTGIGSSASHIYTSAGTFTVKLTVVDNANVSVSAQTSIIISPLPQPTPTPTTFGLDSITQSPDVVFPSTIVTFVAIASGGTQPYTFTWTFADDNSTAVGSTVKHTYSKAGIFGANLTVVDSSTPQQFISADFSVAVSPSPTPPPPPQPQPVPTDILEGVKDLGEGTYSEGVSDIIGGIISLFKQGKISKTNMTTAITRLRTALTASDSGITPPSQPSPECIKKIDDGIADIAEGFTLLGLETVFEGILCLTQQGFTWKQIRSMVKTK